MRALDHGVEKVRTTIYFRDMNEKSSSIIFELESFKLTDLVAKFIQKPHFE